jgi:hypothetical protein
MGTILILLGLSGIPWYNIKVRVAQDLWYVFSYSPFKLIINMGDTIDSDFFYRTDTTIIGIILFLILLLRLYKTDSKKVKYITPFCMGLIILFFTSFLPIHVTTASRLVIGNGSYAIIIGSIILFMSNFSDTIFSSISSLVNKFVNSSILIKIYVFSNIAYFIIKFFIQYYSLIT